MSCMPDLDFQPADPNCLEVASFEVEYEDVFHLQNLYEVAHQWFVENGFTSVEDGDGEFETLYHHKINSGGGVEHRIWWRANKVPRSSDYFKYFLKLDFRTINMSEVTMQRDGEQVKANKGDVIIRVSSHLIMDYKGKWKNSTFGSLFHDYFQKRLYRDRINSEQQQLWQETKDLQATLKDFLDLKTPGARQENFHPKTGL